MTAKVPVRTLPIRRWLALALAAIFVVPVLVSGFITFHLAATPQNTQEMVARILGDGVASWNDPAWQATTRTRLAAEGIDFVLIEDGREIYRSVADPAAGSQGWGDGRVVQELSFPGGGHQLTAYIYTDGSWGPWQRGQSWLLFPIVGFTTLLLTLSGVAWFLGRTVVRPLAATSRAARQVADGDLDIALPSSRVREVAEVSTAFDAMGAALRDSLRQQAEMEQERRLFIGAVVHDLRTPLFALRGSLEGLEQGVADTPEKRARYIGIAQEKAAALERLVTDLFDFTRLEYLEQTPNPEPLDLRALLQRLIEALQPRAEAKGVALVLTCPPGPYVVDGDSHLLTRAAENLLDNALRHTPSGGSVRVTCHAGPDTVGFSVSDTGPGIPAHDLPHLFQPLYRGETSRSRRTGGAGLGLTIARRVVLAHGGDLTARNGDGGGAIFTATLPRSPRSAQAAPSQDAAPTPDAAEALRGSVGTLER